MPGRVSKAPRSRGARWRPLPALLAAAGLLAVSCAAPKPERAPLATGSRLADLPTGYALILGRVRVSVDGEPVVCPAGGPTPGCSLIVHRVLGGSFLVPHQSYARAPGFSGDREPCFVLRLLGGTYQVERLEAAVAEVPERFNRRSGNSVPVEKRFTVGGGEVVYVGTLVVDLPASGSKGAAVRVVDEADAARAVAAEVEPEAGRRLVSRPMR